MSVDPDKLYIVHAKPKFDSHSDAIRQFEGDFECLSNTYKCPVSLRGDPEPYPSVEHALQASKTDDAELKGTIRRAKNAIEAKKLARVVKPTPEWRAGSEKIVEALVRDKFRRNAKARETLVGTGRVKLVYTNAHDDRVWGVCGGKGDNKLGKLLERVRADALSGKDTEVWCTMRFELALPLDVEVALAVSKAGQIVAEPSFEGKPIIRMGKLPDNEVVMAHPSVSRSHALLVVDKTLGAFLIDLGASNGSFVDGRRITPYVPEPIKAGGAGLTFAKSKRTYTLTRVETALREAKKGQLYAKMSDPMASVGRPDPDSTIYVGNLEPSTTEEDLREFFAESGEIASVRIPQDKETGKMRGIAFVAFTKHTGVLHALTLHMDDLNGQSVKIRRADTVPKSRDAGSKPPQQHQQQRHAPKNSASSPPPAPAGPGGGPSGGSGSGSGPDLPRAIEMATAAASRLAEAAASRLAEASKANAAAAAASDPTPKRRRLGDRFGETGSGTKRGNRWGDSDGAATASGTGSRKTHDDGGRRAAERGADDAGRAAAGGRGGERGRGSADRTRRVSGGGEKRASDERSEGGRDGYARSRRGESSERTHARDSGRRRDRDDDVGDRDAREDGGSGRGRRGGGTDRDRRDDRRDRRSTGDRDVGGGGGGRGEDEGRRHRGGSREGGGRQHREGSGRRRRSDEGNRERRGRRSHQDDRRSRSRSRGR
eukprot:g6421.t1